MAIEAANQFKGELLALIRRYGLEADLSVYEALGALDVVKSYLLNLVAKNDAAAQANEDSDDEDFGMGNPVPP